MDNLLGCQYIIFDDSYGSFFRTSMHYFHWL